MLKALQNHNMNSDEEIKREIQSEHRKIINEEEKLYQIKRCETFA